LRKYKKIILAWLFLALPCLSIFAAGEKGDLGLGFRVGLNRLEGDWQNSTFNPFFYGNVNYNLNDFVSLGAEGGYSTLEDKDTPKFQTIIAPYEVHLTLNFFPLSRFNPYAILGGGGVYWNATEDGKTKRDKLNKLQKGVDSFLKAGGGIEFAVNKTKKLYLSVGATYRYSLTDMLDQVYSGDENDGVVDFYAGLSYFFRTSSRGDKDADGIPDELDLEPEQAEDSDGYMDHDGRRDGVPHLTNVQDKEEMDKTKDTTPPVVIHLPIKKVEEGKDIKISAEIFEDKKLKVAAALFRPKGFDHWSVVRLKNLGGILYDGIIPGKYVRKQGLEYCVIAVDESISGVGYCGLPKRPVNVKVIGNPKLWRILNGTAALLGWGTASYILLRKQK